MKSQRQTLLLLCLSVLLLLSACSGDRDGFDKGKVEKGVYTNKYFHLTLPVPAGWQSAGYSGVPMLTDSVPGVPRAQAKSAMFQQTAPTPLKHLLNLTPATSDTGHVFHPSLLLKAECAAADAAAPALYTAQIARTQSHLLPDLGVSPVEREEIGGQSFFVLRTAIRTEYGDTYTDYYTALMRGYYLTFICSYNSELHKEALKKMRASAQFSSKVEG